MNDIKQFCTDLLRADSEAEVINILTRRGYWDKPQYWRHYGDIENNWGQSGNQQSLPEAALAEKIVNSVDARLINECRVKGIDPEGADAPQTVRKAVEKFFGGEVEEWGDKRRREVAEGITLCTTGTRSTKMNITIADCGEGQTPDKFPETILSLSKSNKQRIRFVQGQFNQGGTGALRFCGEENFQLVISRRNPDFVDGVANSRDLEWGFTVVRRETPSDKPGRNKNSAYTYLAPVGIGENDKGRNGEILSFASDTFPIHPEGDDSYGREMSYGTAVKLYEYQYNVSHV